MHKESIDLEQAWFQSRYDKEGPGGGTAEGVGRVWRGTEINLGGIRAVSLDHQVGAESEDDPVRTETLFACRYCGTVHDSNVAECPTPPVSMAYIYLLQRIEN
mgnify:CR=1 FL=1